MTHPNTRFNSLDRVYVRYTYAMRDGRRVFVLQCEGSDKSRARGYQVYRWIEDHSNDARAKLKVMILKDDLLEVSLGDPDLARPIEAYAYTSEKVFYLRTNLAENYPITAFEILASKQENVPDVSPEFIRQHKATLQNISRDLKGAPATERGRPCDGPSRLFPAPWPKSRGGIHLSIEDYGKCMD